MPNHLYPDMKPGDRISRLFQEYIAIPLAPEGFTFSKSLREIKKKNDFFENHISWYTRKYNHGNEVVQFDMHISVISLAGRMVVSEPGSGAIKKFFIHRLF